MPLYLQQFAIVILIEGPVYIDDNSNVILIPIENNNSGHLTSIPEGYDG